MPAELVLISLVLALLVVAYVGIYPRLPSKTLTRLGQIDCVLIVLALVIGGYLYFGSGEGFSLVLFDVPWWAFLLIVWAILEAPLAIRLWRKWDIDVLGGPDQGR